METLLIAWGVFVGVYVFFTRKAAVLYRMLIPFVIAAGGILVFYLLGYALDPTVVTLFVGIVLGSLISFYEVRNVPSRCYAVIVPIAMVSALYFLLQEQWLWFFILLGIGNFLFIRGRRVTQYASSVQVKK